MIKRLNLFIYLIIGIALVIVFCEIKNYIGIKEAAEEMIEVNNDNNENELFRVLAYNLNENLNENKNILNEANN